MADESQQVTSASEPDVDTLRRVERHQQNRRSRRMWLIGASIATAIALGLAGWATAGYFFGRQSELPSRLVVIGETTLEDGTLVAGPIAVIDRSEGMSVTPVDSSQAAAIPGTSYDRMSDALPMGGPELVATLVVGQDAEDTGWVLLTQEAWSQLIDEAGGIDLEVPGETTVFTGEQLFRFEQGLKKLTGDEAVAISLGAESFNGVDTAAQVRGALAQGLGEVAVDASEALAALVADGAATSSEDADALRAFFSEP